VRESRTPGSVRGVLSNGHPYRDSPTLLNPSSNAWKSDIYPGCIRKKEKAGSVMSEDSLLERVTAAAEERQLSHNSLLAYRRTWLKIIAWAASEGLVLETLPSERAGE
jgi:hypothetical protein